ncbi:hypothetical protein, partial [Burkholderia multivorans]|uniref:hypothetical protein n=1 Tax=Burkholderia multivorans TaxID=87883 RepID=UPI0021BF1CAE
RDVSRTATSVRTIRQNGKVSVGAQLKRGHPALLLGLVRVETRANRRSSIETMAIRCLSAEGLRGRHGGPHTTAPIAPAIRIL